MDLITVILTLLALIATAIGAYYTYQSYIKKNPSTSSATVIGIGDAINGDKVGGDKVMGNKIVNEKDKP